MARRDITSITSSVLISPIYALHFHGKFLLSGEGPILHVHDTQSEDKLCSLAVFSSSNIHGIRADVRKLERLCVFGSKHICIVEFSDREASLKTLTAERVFVDWIWDVAWLSPAGEHEDSRLALGLGHNSVILYDWINDIISQHVHCSEKCILYSAKFIGTKWDDLVLAAGTVFNQIVLWAMECPTEDCQRVEPMHRLKGHQGVIFNINFNPKTQQMCSVSDDRSIRLWQAKGLPMIETGTRTRQDWLEVTFEVIHVLYGHSARVWDAALLSNFIISVGEDATCCVWSYEGKIVQKFKGHRATGGGDTSIRLWYLSGAENHSNTTDYKAIQPDHVEDGDFIKCIKLLDEHTVIAMSNEGRLSGYHISSHKWTTYLYDKTYRSYSVIETSRDGRFIALGNIEGKLWVKNCSNGAVVEEMAYNGKVDSIRWLTDGSGSSFILSTGPEGKLILWQIESPASQIQLVKLYSFQLPYTKQRWVSSALKLSEEQLLVCGDRGGTIHVYNLTSEAVDPVQSFPKIHGKVGVTDIVHHGDLLYSVGRDGQYRQYRVVNGRLESTSASKVFKGFEWLARMMFVNEDLLILGFHADQFIMYSTGTNQQLLSIPCGGGHRAWDFVLTGNQGKLIYAKQKDLILAESTCVSNQTVLQPSLHGREISDVKLLFSDATEDGRQYDLATSGEDTLINIVRVSETDLKTTHTVVGTIQGHISSIRCLAVTQSEMTSLSDDNSKVLFSAGGRAQIKAWRMTQNNNHSGSEEISTTSKSDATVRDSSVHHEYLATHMLCMKSGKSRKPWKVAHYDPSPETRYMSLTAVRLDEVYPTLPSSIHVIGCACSDAFVRIFVFDESSRTFHLLGESSTHDHCVLRVKHVLHKEHNSNHRRCFILSAGTGGRIMWWDISSLLIDFASEWTKSNNEKESENKQGLSYKEETCSINTTSAGEENTLLTKPVSCDFISKELSPFFAMKTHQSGINAVDICLLEDETYMIASGGDDNSLSVNIVTVQLERAGKVVLLAEYKNKTAHAAQITGISIIDKTSIITSSIDQRVTAWKAVWNSDQNTIHVHHISSKIIHISDASCLETWSMSKNEAKREVHRAVLSGVGLQVLKIE